MGKEVKVGLAVIGTLLCVFGGVLFLRLRREQPLTAQARVAAAKKDGKLKSGQKQSGKLAKAVKKTESGPALGAGLEGLTSRKSSDESPTSPVSEDRYGRRSEHLDFAAPADDATTNELSEINQTEPPPLETSPYNRPNTDRYGRFEPSEDAMSESRIDEPSLGDEGAGELSSAEIAEESAEEGEGSLEGVPEPADRFAQPADRYAQPGDRFAQPGDRFAQPAERFAQAESAGITFSEVDAAPEAASDTEQTTDDAAGGEESGAPEPLMERPGDRFALEGPAMEEAVEEPAEAVDVEAAALRLSPGADEGSEIRPVANDTYSSRSAEAGSLVGAASLDVEEMVDDANSPLSETTDVEARPLQPRPDDGAYTVEPNDNFWRISQKLYGTGAYFKALEEHNRPQYGDHPLLNVGDVVSTPPLEELRQSYPGLSPKPRQAPAGRRGAAFVSSPAGGRRTYTVAEGDTLFDIARHELGKASRWAEIYELNREQLGEDFNFLSPGTQLALPEGGNKTDPVASRPTRDRYRR